MQRGQCLDGVNKSIDFLVVGDQDFQRFRAGHKSAKLRRAEVLIAGGANLEIVDEHQLLRMI